MKKKIISMILVFTMILGIMSPNLNAYASDDKVRVVVENTTYSVADGAAWDGTLVDTWVSINENSTMMSAVISALDSVNATQVGAEYDYISEINGLAAGSATGYDGWMGTLNDWFTNNGFGYYTVAAGTLEAGDEIRILYSLNMGEDLGGTWSNNDTTVKQVVFSAGTLDIEFSSDVKEYVLTVPYDTEKILVTPTATNKNFQVHTFANAGTGDIEYKRNTEIPVKDGMEITVECGNPDWPTMNAWGVEPNWEGNTYKFTVKVAEAPKPSQALLESLIIHTSTSPNNSNVLLKNAEDSYSTDNVFSADKLQYHFTDSLTDSSNQLRFRAKPASEDYKVTLKYENGSKDITWKTGTSKFANFLTVGMNQFQIVVTSDDTDIADTTYEFSVKVNPTLTGLTASDKNVGFDFDKTFSGSQNIYTVTVPEEQETITFAATPKDTTYEVAYNGQNSNQVNIKNVNVLEIKVSAGEVYNTYTININRVKQSEVEIEATPSDAIVKVYDQNGNVVNKNSNNAYDGMFGTYEYTYTVSKYGYVTESGTIPADGGKIIAVLAEAVDSNIEEVDAYWSNFRGSDTNMAITDVLLPQSEDLENITLKWNQKLGSGWSASPSVQIIVDNALVVMSGTTIYKLDLQTGEILNQGTMVAAPNYGYTPPTYAEGMIFCPLTGGTIQAFNAKTLESVWVYKDSLGGQALSAITYSDGYIYTGFWNAETKNANYVCISVTDEDVNNTNETKSAVWKHKQLGGFYWAGSVVVGDTVIVGTDDGTSATSGTGNLYSFNKYSGTIISHHTVTGDQRSSIAFDKETNKIYFTTKGGWLYSADLNPVTGEITNLKGNDFRAQTTSTPVVYKGRVYFATGSGISSTGSSGNFVVADAETLEMVAAVGLKGYPQCSVLMTNGYEENTGYLYFYCTYNAKPGGISILKVKVDCESVDDIELTELYDAAGFEQYCIASILCGPDGTLYYKNDSGNVLAVGVPSTINTIKFIDAIGTVTLESEEAIQRARAAYDALSEDEKALVTNYEKLVDAEKVYAELLAQEEAKKQENNNQDVTTTTPANSDKGNTEVKDTKTKETKTEETITDETKQESSQEDGDKVEEDEDTTSEEAEDLPTLEEIEETSNSGMLWILGAIVGLALIGTLLIIMKKTRKEN